MPLEEKTASLDLFLAKEAKVKVKAGDQVKKGQVLAQVESGETVEFDLARFLGVAGAQVVHFIRFVAGDEIKAGQTIALRKTFILFNRLFKSPVAGRVVRLTEAGKLIVLVGGERREVVAPAQAKVAAVGQDKITLEFPAVEIVGRAGLGGRGEGPLALVGGRDEEVALTDLSRLLEGKVVVVGGRATADLWQKAQALGAAGLVCGTVSQEVKKAKEALIPLVALEEDGPITSGVWKKLDSLVGQGAIILGEEKRLLVTE